MTFKIQACWGRIGTDLRRMLGVTFPKEPTGSCCTLDSYRNNRKRCRESQSWPGLAALRGVRPDFPG